VPTQSPTSAARGRRASLQRFCAACTERCTAAGRKSFETPERCRPGYVHEQHERHQARMESESVDVAFNADGASARLGSRLRSSCSGPRQQ
jgi:hypothetical protein